jgi:hypothetical protein
MMVMMMVVVVAEGMMHITMLHDPKYGSGTLILRTYDHERWWYQNQFQYHPTIPYCYHTSSFVPTTSIP